MNPISQGEASQLIQYKILLTYLLEGKENMVDSILAKLELSPDTPAVDYVKAAVALQQKNEKEAKDWISGRGEEFFAATEQTFRRITVRSRMAGKASRRSACLVAYHDGRRAHGKRKSSSRVQSSSRLSRLCGSGTSTTARKLVDEADQADPNQATTLNLRGEILMEQKQFR